MANAANLDTCGCLEELEEGPRGLQDDHLQHMLQDCPQSSLEMFSLEDVW